MVVRRQRVKDLTAFEYVMVIRADAALRGVSGEARFFFFCAPEANNHIGQSLKEIVSFLEITY